MNQNTLIRSNVIFQSFFGGANCGVSGEATLGIFFFFFVWRKRLDFATVGVEMHCSKLDLFRLDFTGVFGL